MPAFQLLAILGVVAVPAAGVFADQPGGPRINPPIQTQPPADPNLGAKTKPMTDLYGDPLPPGAIGRLGTARLHGDYCNDVSTRRQTLASLDRDGLVMLWDDATGRDRGTIASGPPTAWMARLRSPPIASSSPRLLKTASAPSIWRVANGA